MKRVTRHRNAKTAQANAIPITNSSGIVPIALLATGTPTGTKFIRDDGTLQSAGGGSFDPGVDNLFTVDQTMTGLTSAVAGANSNDISIVPATVTVGDAGDVLLQGGGVTSGNSGAVAIQSGNATTGTTGIAQVGTGGLSSNTNPSGNTTIYTGSNTGSGGTGTIGIDVGIATTGTHGSIEVGITNANSITIGRPTKTTTINGTLALGTDLAIADGGTGQSTAALAFDALSPTTTTGDLAYRNGSGNIRLAIGTAGQQLAVNSGATGPEWVNPPRIIQRTSDSANVNASIVYVSDGVLQFPVLANKNYWAVWDLYVTTTAAADIRVQLTGPAAPTIVRYSAFYIGASFTSSTLATAFSTSLTLASCAVDTWVQLVMMCMNGANNGTIALQFAQGTSTGVNTFINKGSTVQYQQTN